MFSTKTTTLAALLFTASTTTTTVNAIPIWSRLAALAVRADPTTPAELAQGSNFFFDSLRLEDPCTPNQIGCISSNLATCSQEGNWEITPCTGNTTCLAVPASDTTGIFVSCILFSDAQTDIGNQTVSVDFGVSSPPNNTETAALVPGATGTATTSLDGSVPTGTNSTDGAVPTVSNSTQGFFPTGTNSTDGSFPTNSTDPSIPTETSSDTLNPTPTPLNTNSTTDPTPTNTTDPNATCTDDAPESDTIETEMITVIIQPNPTAPGEFETTTLSPTPTTTTTDDSFIPTSTDDSSLPTATDANSNSTVTATTEIPQPDATGVPSGDGNSTCTEDPSTEDPTDTDTATDGISTEYGSSPTNVTDSTTDPTPTGTDSTDPSTETGLTLTIAPNFSLPSTTDTDTATETSTTPANNVAPSPSPDVTVLGTHNIPASSAPPARMMRVRRV